MCRLVSPRSKGRKNSGCANHAGQTQAPRGEICVCVVFHAQPKTGPEICPTTHLEHKHVRKAPSTQKGKLHESCYPQSRHLKGKPTHHRPSRQWAVPFRRWQFNALRSGRRCRCRHVFHTLESAPLRRRSRRHHRLGTQPISRRASVSFLADDAVKDRTMSSC